MAARNVGNWTKPGFLNKRPVKFGINIRGNANVPLSMNVQEANMLWDGGSWRNLNLDEPPKSAYPSAEDIRRTTEENEKFRVECEVLLNMLTSSEMKKAKNKKILSDKKQRIFVLLDRIQKKRDT